MRTLAARVDDEWRSFTPLHDLTLERARQIAFGAGGPAAGAVVGVYGSGKSALLLALLREAPTHAQATVVVWEEAAPLLQRLVRADERVLPQTFAERVLAFSRAIAGGDQQARETYLEALRARGQGAIADVVAGQLGAFDAADGPRNPPRVLLLLDEVEQAHELLRRCVAVDDGQPLRALIDATDTSFRALFAYAPESFHSVGDADRGRLVYLPVPALDVTAIQQCFSLSRGNASFVWWLSRGRARGAIAATRGIIEPLRLGAFDHALSALGDALDALPGVFGVPAIVREGLGLRELRALIDLVPRRGAGASERGIERSLADREALSDALLVELSRRVATKQDLGPVTHELVGVLAAVADEDEQVFLTMDDFRAALRVAEARALESGRQGEPIERFADQALLAFPALGEMTTLTKRLPLSLATLAEERFPSPFTDPYLPLTEGGRVPTERELARALREREGERGPLWRSEQDDFSVFADEAALARWIEDGALDERAEPLRAVLLSVPAVRAPLVELAHVAGRLRVYDVGAFHGTFLACLALRGATTDGQQLGRKVRWHLDRIALRLRETKPVASPTCLAARRFVRADELRSALSRIKVGSPALLALALPLHPPTLVERRILARLVRLLDAREGIRKVARLVNPGGRLSGAAVVVDELLPPIVDVSRGTGEAPEGARELGDLLASFGTDETQRAWLARWLLPEDAARLASVFAFHGGELPDISREHDQLDALSQLDRTSRRVDTIVAHIAACTGRPEEVARALRLGVVTEQTRASGGPIAGLAALTADVHAASDVEIRASVRTLALWVCGVFADRLLTGVEKEQADLAAWEHVAATTRDVGARAHELGRSFGAIGARACEELLTHARRRLGTHLGSRDALEGSVRALRDLCASLEPIASSVGAFAAALHERGVSVTDALTTYLPDADGPGGEHAAFRRATELLEELPGACPPPQGRSLVAYADLVRRHSEASRRERLRLRLEAVLGLDVPADLRLDDEGVDAIERAWQALSPEARSDLQRDLATAPLPSAEALERLLVHADRKRSLVAQWTADGGAARALGAFDRRAAAYVSRVDTPLAEAQRLAGDRQRAVEALAAVPAIASAEAVQRLVDSAGSLDPAGAFASLTAALEGFGAALGGMLEALARLGVAPPPGTAAQTSAELLRSLQIATERARADREASLTSARAAGVALGSWGERAAPIAAELNVPQAARLAERERARLRQLIVERRDEMEHRLAQCGLERIVLPAVRDDEIAWSEELQVARGALDDLLPLASTLAHLAGDGVPPLVRAATSFGEARRLVQEQLARMEVEQRRLAARIEAALARGRRLANGGATSRSAAPADEVSSDARAIPLPRLRDRVRDVEADVDRLRAARLREVSAAARAAYAAIRGHHDALLPPHVAVLVTLGLVVAAEDAS